MKVPDKIGTLAALSHWVIKNKPLMLRIGIKSKLLKISEFETWEYYRGLRILNEEQLIKKGIWRWVNRITPGVRIVMSLERGTDVVFDKADMVEAIYKVGRIDEKTA